MAVRQRAVVGRHQRLWAIAPTIMAAASMLVSFVNPELTATSLSFDSNFDARRRTSSSAWFSRDCRHCSRRSNTVVAPSFRSSDQASHHIHRQAHRPAWTAFYQHTLFFFLLFKNTSMSSLLFFFRLLFLFFQYIRQICLFVRALHRQGDRARTFLFGNEKLIFHQIKITKQ